MEAKLLSSARIGKTHGLDGSLNLYSLSGETRHLKKLKECVLSFPSGQERSLVVSSVRESGGNLYIKFEGYDCPEKAKVLSGAIIKIRREDAPPLKKGEYYIADLYDMDVMDIQGNILGHIKETREGGQALLLEIESLADDKVYLVPLLDVYISNVDVKNNRLTLLMPELLKQ